MSLRYQRIFNFAATTLLTVCIPLRIFGQTSSESRQNEVSLTADDYILEAAGSYSRSDFGRAESLFQQAISKYPELDAAWYYLGLISQTKGDNEKAEKYLSKAASLDSTNFWYLASLAGLYINANDEAKTVSTCQAIHDRFPKKTTPQIHMILGDYQKSLGKDTLALIHYEDALRINSAYTPAHFSIAEIYRGQGNFFLYFRHMEFFLKDAGINPSFKSKYLNEIVLTPRFVGTFKPQVDSMILFIREAHPRDSSSIRTAASYYMRSDRRDEALGLLRENVKLYPDDHDINIEYISALYYLQKWEELEKEVRGMMIKFPDDETLCEVLAVALWHLKDFEGAAQAYKKQLKKTDNPSIRLACCTALGDLYQEIGELKKAEFYYKKGVAIDPEYIPLLNNYAYFLTKIGKDYQNGLKMSKKTILNEPDNPTYLDTYGWLLFLTGDFQEAKAQFKRAMLFGGKENGVIMDHYADVLWALKDYEMALIYYEQAEKLDPSLNIAEKIKVRKKEIGR